QYPQHSALRPPDLDREVLCYDRLRLGTPPGSGIRSLREAAQLPWVMEPRGTASRHWSEQLCRASGFEPDGRFATADLQAHIRLIESGNAVAVLPDLVWAGRDPVIDMVDLDGAPQRTVFTSVRSASASQPTIVACRQVLQESVGFLTA